MTTSAPAHAPRKAPWGVAFGVASLLLLLGAGGLGYLYQRDQAQAQTQLEDLRTQLDQARADLAAVGRDLEGAQADAQACVRAVQEFVDVSVVPEGEVDDAQARSLLLALISECGITLDLP